MHAFAEHLGTPDEIAGMPIGERDLALGRRGVIHADASGLDQENAVIASTLAEQRLAPIKHATPPATNQPFAFGGGERVEQRWRAAYGADIFRQQQRTPAADFAAGHVEPFRNIPRREDLHIAFRSLRRSFNE